MRLYNKANKSNLTLLDIKRMIRYHKFDINQKCNDDKLSNLVSKNITLTKQYTILQTKISLREQKLLSNEIFINGTPETPNKFIVETIKLVRQEINIKKS